MLTRETITSGWARTRDTTVRHLFLDRSLDHWKSELFPLRGTRQPRARVVQIVNDTRDTKTFVLRPNANWKGHRAGQYISLEVEVDGVRMHRCYSLSSAPKAKLLSITVKRVPDGRVSGWLHDKVRVGDVLGLSPAAGEFVLPDRIPARILMLSGGSGITPLLSMLRDLATRDAIADVVFVHHARSRADVINRADLEEFAEHYPGLKLILGCDDEFGGGFDEERFAELVPDYAERETFLCGPGPLMERVERLWQESGASARLSRESFAPAPRAAASLGPNDVVNVRLTRSGREVTAGGSGTLLEQLERAGERPAHGCRMGICQTCKCRKKSGAVQNVLSGEISNEPDEEIQLCISVPRSDLELNL